MIKIKKVFCLSIVSIVFVLFLLNCGNHSTSTKEIEDSSKQILRYLALGDSYTIGESVAINERYPVQLVDSLRQHGFKMEEPFIIAKTGWTTDELQAGIKQANPKGPFDLVSLLIGVNNQYRGRDAEEYQKEFVELLEQSISFANGQEKRVLVLSIPDWGVTPFAEGRDRQKIAAEIDKFNVLNKKESLERGVHYIDVTPFSRNARSNLALVASDSLHPSGKMYAGWVSLALPKVIETLINNHKN